HSILLETAIELAAIDTECGSGAYLVAAKLLQDRKNVTLLDLRKWNCIVHVSLKHLPEIGGAGLRMRQQNLGRQIRCVQLVVKSDRKRVFDRVFEFANVAGPRILAKS